MYVVLAIPLKDLTDPCGSWQRIYFYFNVARGGRNAALESDDEEEDAAAAGTKSKNEWRAAQEKRVAEGERPPLDKK